jgi:hypothetical protein
VISSLLTRKTFSIELNMESRENDPMETAAVTSRDDHA